MQLALTVGAIVIGVAALVGVLGLLIDRVSEPGGANQQGRRL
jgi:multisubunit Na+/H+ antiporter MnhC subunit